MLKLILIFSNLIILLVGSALFLPTFTYAADIYVSPGSTIQSGVNAAKAGDNVYVKGGTYSENVAVASSGTSDQNRVNIQNAPNEHPIVHGSITVDGKQYVRVSGFEITGTSSGYKGGITISSSTHIRVENNYIHNTSSHAGFYANNIQYTYIGHNKVTYSVRGLEFTTNVYYNIIEGNESAFHDIARGDADGIAIFGGNTRLNIIKNNLVHDVSDDGIDDWSGNYQLIVGNTVYRSGYLVDGSKAPPGEGDGNGFKLGGVDSASSGGGHLVINNVSYNNASSGYTTELGSHTSVIVNNVSYHNDDYGYEDYGNVDPSVFRNDIAFNNGKKNYTFLPGTINDHNLFSADPLFGDAGAFDFHLRAGSPAINTGRTLTEADVPAIFLTGAGSGLPAPLPDSFRQEVLWQISHDKDGNPRPQGGVWDIGAYEYTSGSNPTPTPKSTPTPSCAKPSDVNCDGAVNFFDLKLIFSSWLGNGNCSGFNCDLNGDGKVNGVDFGYIIRDW